MKEIILPVTASIFLIFFFITFFKINPATKILKRWQVAGILSGVLGFALAAICGYDNREVFIICIVAAIVTLIYFFLIWTMPRKTSLPEK